MLPALTFFHQRLAYALVAMAILLGLLGIFDLMTRRRPSGGLRAGYLLMIGLVAVEGLPGAVALLAGGHPREILHVVYGIFAIAFLPGVFVFARSRRPDTEAAVLTTACWVVTIAYFRGIATGS